MVEAQACTTCGIEKPLTEFNWANRALGKRQKMCRECFRVYNAARYAADPDRFKKAANEYRLEHLEEVQRKKREAYWRDPEASRAAGRKNSAVQNAKRKDIKIAWARAKRAANPDQWRAAQREAYAKNPDAHREKAHRHRARKRGLAIGDVSPELLQQKLAYWGGNCWMCGETASEWDHVKPLSKGGSHCLANLRPACRSCNAQKQAKWPFPTSPHAQAA